ncbi:hypothetical protein Ade02nite_70760 [Paractinoplanes deccanensis]|uniref:Uncharacterized protein n=1 Tax=Paractinoplanes deccanensis TaxID=113561 RepID=A0ABQ3YF53_9ACTN|nr:hypothetical protein Ade02nite_70760 [Actinoplanes deccanensis]
MDALVVVLLVMLAVRAVGTVSVALVRPARADVRRRAAAPGPCLSPVMALPPASATGSGRLRDRRGGHDDVP